MPGGLLWICGVFFLRLATLLLHVPPRLFLPKDGMVLVCLGVRLGGGNGVGVQGAVSGWGRFGRWLRGGVESSSMGASWALASARWGALGGR